MGWVKAFMAGVIGAAVIAAIMGIAIGAGFKIMDFSLLWGTLIGLPVGPAAWIAGFCIHLLAGGLFALLYAAIFKMFSAAGAMRGGIIGIVHAIVTGIAIALLPLVDPAVESGRLKAPGPYFSGHGVAGILFYFGIHIIYGAIVGALYFRMVLKASGKIPAQVDDQLRIVA